jgi:hypothetical protein
VISNARAPGVPVNTNEEGVTEKYGHSDPDDFRKMAKFESRRK